MAQLHKGIAVLLLVILLVAAAGCTTTKSDPTDTYTTPTTSAPTDPTVTDPTTDPTTEPPTNPPTELPTEPPTEMPTEPPTEPPTQPPTVPPTETPTQPPETLVVWVEEGGKRYCYNEDGVMLTGLQIISGDRYYFAEDGAMAVGKVQLGDRTLYFGSNGVEILLVNPWNYVPDDYNPEIVLIDDWRKGSAVCKDALMELLQACRDAGHKPYVSSSYRTHGDQVYLHNRMIQRYIDRGYSQEEAYAIASTIVAIPGTSEHELGLAFDIVDNDYRELNSAQEETETQKWLMEHCWEYGFILRYPSSKSDITGIIYEPWHYRYVGVEEALKIRDSGLCLEEYLLTLG